MSITSNVLKFADDTKLFRKVNTDGDKQHLQNDLDNVLIFTVNTISRNMYKIWAPVFFQVHNS